MATHQPGLKETDRTRLDLFQQRQGVRLRKAAATARECFREREVAAAAGTSQVRGGGRGKRRLRLRACVRSCAKSAGCSRSRLLCLVVVIEFFWLTRV